MLTKNYLRQIRSLKDKIDILESEIRVLKTAACSISAVAYDKDRVQGTAAGDAMANQVIAYTEKEKKYAQLVDKYISLREKIVSQILTMDDDRYRSLLYKRYVEGKKFEVIAEEMTYDVYWTIKLHGSALLSFGRKYPT